MARRQLGSSRIPAGLGLRRLGMGELMDKLGIREPEADLNSSQTFVVCWILMTLINFIPGCKFRTDEEGEIVGVDDAECGEWAVSPDSLSFGAETEFRLHLQYDFVHIRRDVESTSGMARVASHHGNREAAHVTHVVEEHNSSNHATPAGSDKELNEKGQASAVAV